MSPRKTDAEIEQLWQAHAWGGKHLEELREDHRRARADRAVLLEALQALVERRDRAFTNGGGFVSRDGEDGRYARARAAIAQAEGREP